MNQSLIALLVNGTITYEVARERSLDPEDLSLKLRKMFPKIEEAQREGDHDAVACATSPQIVELMEIKKLYEEQEERWKSRYLEKDEQIAQLEQDLAELRQEARHATARLSSSCATSSRRCAPIASASSRKPTLRIDKLNERIRELNQQLAGTPRRRPGSATARQATVGVLQEVGPPPPGLKATGSRLKDHRHPQPGVTGGHSAGHPPPTLRGWSPAVRGAGCARSGAAVDRGPPGPLPGEPSGATSTAPYRAGQSTTHPAGLEPRGPGGQPLSIRGRRGPSASACPALRRGTVQSSHDRATHRAGGPRDLGRHPARPLAGRDRPRRPRDDQGRADLLAADGGARARRGRPAGASPTCCWCRPTTSAGGCGRRRWRRSARPSSSPRVPAWHRARYEAMNKYVEVLGAEDPARVRRPHGRPGPVAGRHRPAVSPTCGWPAAGCSRSTPPRASPRWRGSTSTSTCASSCAPRPPTRAR